MSQVRLWRSKCRWSGSGAAADILLPAGCREWALAATRAGQSGAALSKPMPVSSDVSYADTMMLARLFRVRDVPAGPGIAATPVHAVDASVSPLLDHARSVSVRVAVWVVTRR